MFHCSPVFKERNILVLILIIGAFLRLFNLGRESYWFDEAGVAVSASQPLLSQALDIAHDHVSAMPLDYVVAWFFGRISLDEGFLRLPEALWGIAGIWSAYFFAKKIVNKKIALFTALMVSLAPTHIYFSQELRFYSPFFFFYWLLCGLLYKVQDQPDWKNWLKVIIVSIIGAYFCIFTLLAFFLAPGLFFLSAEDRVFKKNLLRRFFISITIIMLTILPGFLYYGMETPMDYGISWRVIAQPMIAAGWLPIYSTLPGFLLGFVTFILTITGLTLVLRSRNKHFINLIMVTVVQYFIITTAVIISGYFIAWRQYFFTLPVTLMLVGYTIEVFSNHKKPILLINKENLENYYLVNKSLANFLFGCLCILSIFTFTENQNFVKSTAREITNLLHNEWQPGDHVAAIPWYTPLLYRFYLNESYEDRRFSEQIEGINWDTVGDLFQLNGRILLVTEQIPSYETYDLLVSHGFKLLTNLSDPNLIWLRDLNTVN